MTFEKQVFTKAQIARLFQSAEKNLATAARNEEAEYLRWGYTVLERAKKLSRVSR